MCTLDLFVGVDIGGTFTDIVFFDEETNSSPSVVKIPTTPTQPEKAVVESLAQNPKVAQKIRLLSHATTISTNALLTRAGLARTALISNDGFRDILEIGRQRRPEIYNLQTKKPVPIVERKDRLTIKERTLSDGSHQQRMAETDLRRLAKKIVAARYSSVAISLLNSYANPESEQLVGTILRKSGFEGHIDLSSEIDPQYREYERASTTVVNAALAPMISKYLIALKHGLERIGVTCPVYVMNSDGTISTASQASNRPISIIESGPAAGVLSSKYLAQLLSLNRVISFDMGGTTAKAGTIVNGHPDLSYEFEAAGRTYHGRSIKGSGYPVRQSFIDLAEVSAGGGTTAWLDDAHNLQVGPESAGAKPGPAAYGKGGKRATVTDANIVAGRINPARLLGGQLRLYYDLAAKAIRKLSRRLKIPIDNTAENILRIVNSNMSKALSLVSIERGRDPREYTLIAFGGAGPLHACDLAEELGIRKIIIPLHPGLFSAFGLLTAELSRTFSRTILQPATTSLEHSFKQLRLQARKELYQEGFGTYGTRESVDLRYQGQAYEITVPYKKKTNLQRLFGLEHKKLYGYSSNDTVEAVNARIQATIPTPKASLAEKKLTRTKTSSISSRRVWLSETWMKVPIYDRAIFRAGVHGKGPCIVEEYDSTTVVGRSWSWKVDPYDDIVLSFAG